jgi:hypothetical protein
LRHKGIAVAICDSGDSAPALVERDMPWSRIEVLDWVLASAGEADTLFGFDLSAAFAFVDRGAYFPGWAESPADVRGLWRLVEATCAEELDLAASNFVDPRRSQPTLPPPRRTLRRHVSGGRGRMRVVEQEERRIGLVNPVSNFNLVGAAQVGKSSMTGMRLFVRLDPHLPIWPFDRCPDEGSAWSRSTPSIAAGRGRPAARADQGA